MFNIYRNRITGGTKFSVNFQFTIKSNRLPSLKTLNFYHFPKTRCHIKITFSFTIGRSMQKQKLSVQKDAIIKKKMGKSLKETYILKSYNMKKKMKRRKNALKMPRYFQNVPKLDEKNVIN